MSSEVVGVGGNGTNNSQMIIYVVDIVLAKTFVWVSP